MFCTSCGAHVPEEAQFCTNCGASLAGAAMGSDATAVVPGEQMDTAFSGNYANGAYQGDVPVTQGYGSSVPSFAAAHPVMDPTSDDIRRKLSETSSATMLPQPRKPASTKILLGVLAAGALALVAVFGFAVSGTGGGGGGTTPAYASGPKLAFVDFDMDSEDGLEGASEVPIAIEGKDYEGNPVATRVTYHPKQGPVAVRPGTYTARILASPVSQDGKLYRYPEKTYDLTIPESAAVTLNPSTGVASESGEDASADSSAGTDATSASDANAEGGETPDNAVSDQETPDGASFDSGEASTEGVEGDGIGSAQDLSSAEEYPSIVVGSDDPIVFEIRDDASEEEVAQANQVREEAQEQMAASDIVYNEEEALTILETHVDQEGQNASSSSSQHASPEQQSASSSNAASSSDPAPAAKVDKSNLFSAYLKIVKAYSEAQRSSSHKPETDIAPNSINDAVVSDASNLRYAFFDINGDGVEELLVGESSVTPFAFQIFTTSDVAAGTVVEVGRSQAKTPIVICENGVMAESAITMGGLTSTTYRRLPAHGSAWETIESIESDLSAKPTKNIRTDASGSTTDVTEAQAKEVRDTYKPQRCIGWKPVAGFNEDAVRDYLAKLNDNPDQARKSLQHYSSSVIQFDMPQNWVDIVTGDTLDHTSGVYHVDFNLVGGTIGSFPMVFRVDGMEGDSSVSCSWIDSLGEVVWDQAHDASMYANLSDQDMDFVVTALTGGAVTRAQLLAETDRAACQLLAQKHVDEFMRTQVVPNVVASSDGSQGEGPAPENAASTTPAAPEPEPQLEPDPEPAPEASLPEQMLASMDGDWTTVSVGRRNGIMRITGGVCESISNDGQSRLYCTITPDIFERYDNGLSGEFNGGPGYFIPTGNYDYGFYVSDEDFYDNGRIDGLVPIRRDGSGYSGGDTLARVEDLDF